MNRAESAESKAKVKISKEFEYINRIAANVYELDLKELDHLYHNLKEAQLVVPHGSGRSLAAIKIPSSELARIGGQTIILAGEVGFPGDGYKDLEVIEGEYQRIAVVLNSGSGASETPRSFGENLAKHIEEQGSNHFTINAITSNPASPIGRVARKYGALVQLKGRREEWRETGFAEGGIMNDIYELGSLFTFHGVVEALYQGQKPSLLFPSYRDTFLPQLGEKIDWAVNSSEYQVLVDLLRERRDVFFGGMGSGDVVAEMTARRLFHVKNVLQDSVYMVRGVNTRRTRPGDVNIFISYSGETEPVIHWCRRVKRKRAHIFSVVGRVGSTLHRLSDHAIILGEKELQPREPNRFYVEAAFVLSPLPVILCEELKKEGFLLPPEILEALAHVDIE